MALQKQLLEIDGQLFEHYYLCNYAPKSAGFDNLSKSLLRFKSGLDPDVAAWTACSLMEISKIRFESKFLILRVLHSYETKIEHKEKTPMDRLRLKIATKYQGRYKPNLLHKTRKTQKSKIVISAGKGEGVSKCLCLSSR